MKYGYKTPRALSVHTFIKILQNCAQNQQQTPKTTSASTPEVLPESDCDVGHPKAEAHQAHNSGDAPTVC